jgi:nucleolar protein 9
LLEHAPEKVIGTLWDTYIMDKIGRLVIHPVANFVVAAGFARLEGERLVSAIQEMSKAVPKCLSESSLIYRWLLILFS